MRSACTTGTPSFMSRRTARLETGVMIAAETRTARNVRAPSASASSSPSLLTTMTW
jgi:hypothetical protein